MSTIENDACSPAQAATLKEQIERVWISRGYPPGSVNIEIRMEGFDPALRTARCVIRSDMINGRPCCDMPKRQGGPA